MRCPSCAKFVSNGELEIEVASDDFSGMEVCVSVILTIPCGECGEQLSQAELDINIQLEGCTCENPEDSQIEIDELEFSSTEDFRPKVSKTGKPVPFRYQKHYYGAEIFAGGFCSTCKNKVAGSGEVEELSSAFQQLN